jgi:hypothetical protein
MSEDSWKIARIFLEWGTLVACIIALVQGSGGLSPSSVCTLAILGAAAATTAVFEHGWYKPWFRCLFCLLVIWGCMAWLSYEVWPKKPEAQKVTPLVTWFPKSPINEGDPLTDAQLNATALVGGIPIGQDQAMPIYDPAPGTTTLPPGIQTLRVKFMPQAPNIVEADKTVTIKVLASPKPPVVPQSPATPAKEPPRFKIIDLTIQPLPRPETRGIVRFQYQNVGETASQGVSVQFATLPRTTSFQPALAFYDKRTALIEPNDKPIAVGQYLEFGDDGYYDIRIKITFKSLGNQPEQPPQCFFYKWGGRLFPYKIEPLNEEEQKQTEKYFKLHEPAQP